jgi:recombinational DNA repair protein (RecF pathway)
MYLRDRVIVLKKDPYREHDRRYVMYGIEHGLLSAVARGASLPKSKQAGHLEPFSEAEVMIAKGVAFDKLAVAKLVPGSAVRDVQRSTSLVALTTLGAFADLVIRLSRPGISDERIFELLKELVEVLSVLPSEPSADRSRFLHATAMLKLLDLIGFGPAIEMEDAQLATVLKFMRGAALSDILRVTASREILQNASSFVEEALTQAPLDADPHGVQTIRSYVG